jgi:1,2-dihydroxy-3-keto-5-methylthiopentene dioxygenase
MKAYYYNDKAEGDGRYPHQFEPNQEVTQEQLIKLGVLYWSLKPETWEEEVEAICKQRDYKNRDQVIIIC